MHLLLVEPDPNLARIMGELFIADGHSVIAATDRIGATQAVVSTRVEAAVISQELPGGEGLEVVRALRRGEPRGAQALVVLIAAQVDEDLRRRAAALGVAHVLARPVSLLDLGELVRAAPMPGPAPSRPFHPINAAMISRRRTSADRDQNRAARSPAMWRLRASSASLIGR